MLPSNYFPLFNDVSSKNAVVQHPDEGKVTSDPALKPPSDGSERDKMCTEYSILHAIYVALEVTDTSSSPVAPLIRLDNKPRPNPDIEIVPPLNESTITPTVLHSTTEYQAN